MGANQSILSAGTPSNGPNLISKSNSNEIYTSAKLAHRHGFQILRIHPNSPISEARLFTYFDYIISINDVEVVKNKIINVICYLLKFYNLLID